MADKNASLNEVLDDIQKLGEREATLVVSMNEFAKHEQALLNTVMLIIEKDPSIEFYRDAHDNYFLDADEFHAIL